MPYRRLPLTLPIALLLLALLLSPSPAFAGFQWVAPPADTGMAQAPLMPAPMVMPVSPVTPVTPGASVATSSPEVISPVVIGDGSKKAPMAEHTLMLPPAASAPSSSQEVVRGFARQVPLPVALKQILPQGYAFSINPDVDLGVLVSFQGGHPWRETLQSALDPAGLVMHEQGQMVTIGRPDAMMPLSPNEVVSIPATPASPSVIVPVTETPVVTTTTVTTTAPDLSQTWKAERGDSLRKVLEDWSHKAGAEVNWQAEYDFPLQASVVFTGSYEDAVRNLLTGFQDAHPQPIASLHDNAKLGQKVLVVEVRGNSYAD